MIYIETCKLKTEAVAETKTITQREVKSMKTREERLNEIQNQINAKMDVINSLPLSIHHYPELVSEVDALAAQRDALQAQIAAESKAAANAYMQSQGWGDVFQA